MTSSISDISSNISDVRPSTSGGHETDTINPKIPGSQCTDDAEFVEQVMRKDIECVSEIMKRTEESDAANAMKASDASSIENLSGNTEERNNQLEKRKRESDSEISDDNVNVRKKSKGVSLKYKGRRNAPKLVSDKIKDSSLDKPDSDISDIETETDTDLVIMLKALTILEKKIDKRFDEIKENNSDSIQQIKGEIDSVRSECNNKIEGLSKKIENKVTDSVQKRLDEKMKGAQADLKKSLSRTVLKEVGDDINKAHDRMNRLDSSIKTLQDLVSDVMSQNDPLSRVEEREQNIIIRNLPETENENTLNKVHSLIKDGLSLRDASCTRAVRKQSRRKSQYGVIIATCRDKDTKADIMKAKSNLKHHRIYDKVFIEHDRSRSERNQISSLRTLVQAVGKDKVRMRGNRVVYYNAEPPERDDTSMDIDQGENRADRIRGNSHRERRNNNRDDGTPYRPRRPPTERREYRDRGQERERDYRYNRYEPRDQDRRNSRDKRMEDHHGYRDSRRDAGRLRREQSGGRR